MLKVLYDAARLNAVSMKSGLGDRNNDAADNETSDVELRSQ